MNQTVINAINNKKLLAFTYDGFYRTVEPHTYGLSKKGKPSLSAFQVSGGHASDHLDGWHLFSLEKISTLTVLQDGFDTHRNGYKRNDSRMTTIYAQL